MKIRLISVGKNHEQYVKDGIGDFTNRISKYYPVEWIIIPALKNAAALPQRDIKKREAENILQHISKDDYLVVLDERGKGFSSEKLASFIQLRANESTKNLVFLIGGAYGVDESILDKAGLKWSLSDLTFPHQLVRLILSEQLYRACSILRNEKYHHS